MDLSNKEIANPYFNAFEKTTIKDLEEQFQLEDAQMTIFDYLDN